MAHVLLVDDEPLVVESLASAIRSKGHTVVTAANGNEGIRKFSEGRFDLVITDIIMPEKEGIETIMEIRRSAPRIKIVAISGGGRMGNVEFLKMARKLGAMATLKKPIRLAELYLTLDKCLGEEASAKGA